MFVFVFFQEDGRVLPSADMVKNAFNQGSYLGIRSLPNALKPDVSITSTLASIARKRAASASTSGASVGPQD